MKKGLSIAACAAMMVTSLVAQADAKELKFGTFFPDRTPFFKKILLPWVDDFNKQAGGDTTIKVFAGGTLNRDPRKQLDMIRAGIADITIVIPGVHRAKF